MRSEQTFLNALFPKARAEIFRLLFDSKKCPRYVREIMGDSGLALRSIQGELKKARRDTCGDQSYSNGYDRFLSPTGTIPYFAK